jgi:hypothetical protein
MKEITTKTDWRFNVEGKLCLRTWNKKTREIVKEETPESKGLFREKEFFIVFKRTALDPTTLRNVSGYFIQKLLFKVPNKEGYDCHYFYFEKGFSVPCARILDPRLQNLCGLTFQVSPNDPRFVKNIGEPVRITNEVAKKAMLDREYESIPLLGLYDESGYEVV